MNLKKIKNKVLSFSITSALISSITAINAYASDNNAGVDISGGINKAINEVKIQFKDVVAVIFGFLTLVALTVAVAKDCSAIVIRELKFHGQESEWHLVLLLFVAWLPEQASLVGLV